MVPPAYELGPGLRTIDIREFDDDTTYAIDEPKVFYNPKHEEGRRELDRLERRRLQAAATFSYALAHNMALRYDEAEDALEAAGLPRPAIRLVTRAHPSGVVATGGTFGSGFEHAPPNLPAAAVRIGGSVRRGRFATIDIQDARGSRRHEVTAADFGGLVAAAADLLSPREEK